MKKAIVIIAALALTMPLKGFSQDKFVVSAGASLKEGNLDDAKQDIDKAMANPETAEKPKALWVKAQIYDDLQQSDKYKASAPYKEAAQALIKLSEVKPEYEKASVVPKLHNYAINYYNEAIKAFKSDPPKYDETADLMRMVVKICNLNDGKRFEGDKNIDTMRATANRIAANCIYFSGKYDEAIPLLIEVKNNPINKIPSAYTNLIDAYDKTKNTTQELATIQEARAAFPENEQIRNYELNYYITSGKQDEMVKKLEEAAAQKPNDPELQISIATAYSGMANPKAGKAPDNRAELIAKAEAAFQKAVTLSPENAEYNYYFGVLYYNEAKLVNDQMNDITGSSAADLKKYDALKVKRDAFFDKALPYIDKAYNSLDAHVSTLKDSEKKVYKGSMQALTQIYAIQSKMDKVEALKKKMDAYNGK